MALPALSSSLLPGRGAAWVRRMGPGVEAALRQCTVRRVAGSATSDGDAASGERWRFWVLLRFWVQQRCASGWCDGLPLGRGSR